MGDPEPQAFDVSSRVGRVRGLRGGPAVGRSIWVLHGRGGSAAAVWPVATALLRAMTAGVLLPATVVVPDGPWNDGMHWWVDSTFSGSVDVPSGLAVESALLLDVLPAVDPAPDASPAGHRTVVGVSMGGVAAARWSLLRPDVFHAAVLLSPACYDDGPPATSSAVLGGAFGRAGELFSQDAYRELASVQHLLQRRPRGAVTDISVVVGDEEQPQENESGRPADLTVEAARLHARLRRRTDIRPSLRVVAGGHDMDVWTRHVVGAAVRARLGETSGSPAHRAPVSAARGGTAG